MSGTHHAVGEKLPSLNGAHADRFVLASKYGPDPGADGFDTVTAPNVLRALACSWESIQTKEYDGNTPRDLFYGLVVFGSLIKGRFHKKSDVDAWLLRRPEIPQGRGRAALPDITRDIENAMHNRGIDYRLDARQVATNVGAQLAAFRKAQVNPADLPKAVKCGIRNLFLLSVGTGEIPELRGELLDGLEREQYGGIAWRAIAHKVVAFEEHTRKGNFTMPDTVAGARDYYNCIGLEQELLKPPVSVS